MTLSQKQRRFTLMVGQLIVWAYDHGYELTFGEAYRTPEQAAANAKKGTGIARSLHTDRLAVDLNLFIDGKYQTDSAAYQVIGVFWESLGGSWGGRFTDSGGRAKPDGNHFSLPWNGRK
jgi:hypothetical protein